MRLGPVVVGAIAVFVLVLVSLVVQGRRQAIDLKHNKPTRG